MTFELKDLMTFAAFGISCLSLFLVYRKDRRSTEVEIVRRKAAVISQLLLAEQSGFTVIRQVEKLQKLNNEIGSGAATQQAYSVVKATLTQILGEIAETRRETVRIDTVGATSHQTLVEFERGLAMSEYALSNIRHLMQVTSQEVIDLTAQKLEAERLSKPA